MPIDRLENSDSYRFVTGTTEGSPTEDRTGISDITRRGVLGGVAAGAMLLSASRGAAAQVENTGFTHGIASGDPTPNAVVLWTRYVAPAGQPNDMIVEVSTDETFTTVLKKARITAAADRDHTAKIDMVGLEPATTYFYRFMAGGTISPVGRTKTLPAATSTADFKLSLVSCSNYPQGLFHAYREIANSDTDMVLHLGDYIYEYAAGVYANEKAIKLGRKVQPATEIVSLDDYHQRYAVYRSDLDLQAVHARHPFICVWDDHETANDSWKDGAENHQPDEEGDYSDRKRAARQAWLNWLPVRETVDTKAGKIYRTFEIGQLASLIMMDTRIIGRDKPYSYQGDLIYREIPFDFSDPTAPVALLSKEAYGAANQAAIKSIPVPFDLRSGQPTPVTDWATLQTLSPESLPEGFAYLPDLDRFRAEKLEDKERTILGAEQEAWLESELNASVTAGKTWQLLGQQLLMGKLTMPTLDPSAIDFTKSKFITEKNFAFFQLLAASKMPLNLDAWDGYAACRDRVLSMIRRTGAKAISFAGDTHNAWGFELADTNGAVAVEVGTPGVSSPGLETYLPIATDIVDASLKSSSPELKYLNSHQRGWTDVTLKMDRLLIEWKFVSTVLDSNYEVIAKDSYEVLASAATRISKLGV